MTPRLAVSVLLTLVQNRILAGGPFGGKMKKRKVIAHEEQPSPDVGRAWLKQVTWRRAAWGGGISLLAVVFVWTAGNAFFTRIVVARSTVSGTASNASIEQLISRNTANYRLTINYPGNSTKSFSWRDIGLQVEPGATVQAIRRAQHSWPQLAEWWRPIMEPVQVRTDAAKFASFVTQNATVVTSAPQNAELRVANGAAQIVAAAAGKQYGLTNAAATILASATHLQQTPLSLQPVALPAARTATSLAGAKAKLQTILDQHISIAIGDQTVTPSASDIGGWITITPDDSSTNFSVNPASVQSYLSQLAAGHSQTPRSQVVLSGGSIAQAGIRGMLVSAPQSAVDALAGAVPLAKGAQVALPVQYTAFQTVHAPTAGKWIEVNLATKRLYAYDQGQLQRTILVSAGAPATPTVTGQFAIYSKYRSQNMYGGNVDGSNYFQPNVPWVNYFYKDFAIHGNYWRPSYYFGNVNSSHGCVGVPVSDGAWIYSWAPIGTPVLVHY